SRRCEVCFLREKLDAHRRRATGATGAGLRLCCESDDRTCATDHEQTLKLTARQSECQVWSFVQPRAHAVHGLCFRNGRSSNEFVRESSMSSSRSLHAHDLMRTRSSADGGTGHAERYADQASPAPGRSMPRQARRFLVLTLV